MLNNENVWTEDPEELKRIATDFYKELYTSQATTPCPHRISFLTLTAGDLRSLNREVIPQ